MMVKIRKHEYTAESKELAVKRVSAGKGIGAVTPAREGCGVIVNGQSGEARSDAPGRRLGNGRAS